MSRLQDVRWGSTVFGLPAQSELAEQMALNSLKAAARALSLATASLRPSPIPQLQITDSILFPASCSQNQEPPSFALALDALKLIKQKINFSNVTWFPFHKFNQL